MTKTEMGVIAKPVKIPFLSEIPLIWANKLIPIILATNLTVIIDNPIHTPVTTLCHSMVAAINTNKSTDNKSPKVPNPGCEGEKPFAHDGKPTQRLMWLKPGTILNYGLK